MKLNLKNKSITIKLFVITAAFFLVFTSVTMVLQSVFIGSFYQSRKLEIFQKNFTTFKQAFDSNFNNGNTEAVENAISSFETTNNGQLFLYNISLQKTYYFDNSAGNFLQSSGMYGNTDKTIRAVITEGVSTKSYHDMLYQGKTIVFKSKYSTNNINTVVGISPIISNGTITSVIVVISSLQPIGEAADVIREFYIYFYILAIVLILILSLLFSNMIAKPLKKLNKAAMKMSQLDFTEKCTIISKDEIGNLAGTLNFLSDNLSSSLNELQMANEKLKGDIEREKHLEIMRKEFVAGVSHELKTPLALISGYAEGLKDNIAEEDEKEYYLDVIMDESQKMNILISDMLDLSQLESGNFKLDKYDFDLEELITSVVKKHATLFEEKHITTTLEIHSDKFQVYGDSFRIEQVITNLLGNALKHTLENGNIFISLSQVGAKLKVEIENQGPNIPNAELENIWEKFYKVDKSRNRDLGGSGIGLSIVKNILTLHGSSFGVVNTATGVKFYFDLGINALVGSK